MRLVILRARPAAPADGRRPVAVPLLEVAGRVDADAEVGDRRDLREVQRGRAVAELPVGQEAEDLALEPTRADCRARRRPGVLGRRRPGHRFRGDDRGRVDRRLVDVVGQGRGLGGGRFGRDGRRGLGRGNGGLGGRRWLGRPRGRRRLWLQRRRVPLPQLTTVEAPGGKRPRADPADLPGVARPRREPDRDSPAGRELDLVVRVGPSFLVMDRRAELGAVGTA